MTESPVPTAEAGKPPLLANRPFVIGLLYILGPWTGFTGLIGVVLAYVFRSGEHEEWEASHFRYLIATFWVTFIVFAALMTVMFTLIFATEQSEWMFLFFAGFLIMIVYGGVRTVLSMMRSSDAKPMPRPGSLLF